MRSGYFGDCRALSPLRRRIQASIDRRFYRRKYDAAWTLQAIDARIRDQVEMSTLTDDIVDVVHNMAQS